MFEALNYGVNLNLYFSQFELKFSTGIYLFIYIFLILCPVLLLLLLLFFYGLLGLILSHKQYC